MEKYSRGWRGAPAKGVGRLRGARVQIPLSPFIFLKNEVKNFWKKVLTNRFQSVRMYLADAVTNDSKKTKNLDNWTVKQPWKF